MLNISKKPSSYLNASHIGKFVDDSSNYSGIRSKEVTAPAVNLTPTDTWKSLGYATLTYKQADHSQIFRGEIQAWHKAGIDLSVTKETVSNCTDLVKGNPNYSLDGTTFEIYDNKGSRVKDIDGKPATITIKADAGETTGTSNTVSLNADYADQTVCLKKTKAGKGYILNSDKTAVKLPKAGESTNPTIANTPVADPDMIAIKKESSNNENGISTGLSSLANAEYTVEQYYNAADATTGKNKVRDWVYKTNSDGKISFNNSDGSLVSGTL